jgi:hypothetical protein
MPEKTEPHALARALRGASGRPERVRKPEGRWQAHQMRLGGFENV